MALIARLIHVNNTFAYSIILHKWIRINVYNPLQTITDNVDHNIRTLDGKDTFHGMGIIAKVPPNAYQTSVIP